MVEVQLALQDLKVKEEYQVLEDYQDRMVRQDLKVLHKKLSLHTIFNKLLYRSNR